MAKGRTLGKLLLSFGIALVVTTADENARKKKEQLKKEKEVKEKEIEIIIIEIEV